MASIIRLLVGIPVAAVITFLLFMLMQRLILTDEVVIEEADDELSHLDFRRNRGSVRSVSVKSPWMT
jgi:hypothetical protein